MKAEQGRRWTRGGGATYAGHVDTGGHSAGVAPAQPCAVGGSRAEDRKQRRCRGSDLTIQTMALTRGSPVAGSILVPHDGSAAVVPRPASGTLNGLIPDQHPAPSQAQPAYPT